MQKSLKNKLVIGIDEVGRGPIAGPVAVGAFAILKPEQVRRERLFRGVKESKQLSAEAREKWFASINAAQKRGLVDFHVVFQSHAVIDAKGISHAIRTALAGALKKVSENASNASTVQSNDFFVLLDGGLKAPEHFKHQKTIIRGDAKEQAIALASICAKVLRDRRMIKLAKALPGYGFEVHKGYGTKTHYAAIRKLGFSSHHRLTFCTNLLI